MKDRLNHITGWNPGVVGEKCMQWVKNMNIKMVGSFLLVSMVFGGSVLSANPVEGIAKPQGKQEQANDRVVAPISKEDLQRQRQVNEINGYLSKMDADELSGIVRFFHVEQLLKDEYVHDVSAEELISGAIEGCVSALGDPYSVYMDPSKYSKLMIETKGLFSGVGIILGIKNERITVVSPIAGTPAEEAGIMSGDQILKIDGVSTDDIMIDEAIDMIRGVEGSKVKLTMKRAGEAVKEYTIIRSSIVIKSVSGKMLEHGIGYIRLSIFNENSSGDLYEKIQELEGQGMRGIILDLRNNPGGLLEESIKVASQFVPQGPIVSIMDKNGIKFTHFSALEETRVNYPLVLLVNGGSASASEIVAGAIQDTAVGTLVGTTTFGKGSVQNVVPLDDESAIKLTIAEYITPNERSINGVGIEPDIEVEMVEAKENGYDVQLKKAIEVLRKML